MKRGIFAFVAVLCGLSAGTAFGNWQYDGGYGYVNGYGNGGAGAYVSLRGGASLAMAKMKNDTSIIFAYCVNTETGEVQDWSGTCADGFEYATGELGGLGLPKMSEVNFAAGASLGWILSGAPQWRFELAWDHFSNVDYNESPLFSGDMRLSNGGTIPGVAVGGVQSTMGTDIISVMAFYDFFNGFQKPIRTIIPYVGLGFGYADTKTEMNFYDQTGDLYGFDILNNFGEDSGVVVNFYKSTKNTTNVAGVLALGLSYGLDENLFFDFGMRAAYLPRVKYTLSNSDGTNHLDWFSAKNLIYTSLMFGLRVEF
ncbi:MAG: hypothetical protein J6Y07_00485 [Alphaproteobacteria bacterium]|nr:hypothetical protein [Alphaproteobacteria bacterium]